MPEDTEELALSLNGWKKKLMREDFLEAILSSGIDKVVAERIIGRFQKYQNKWNELIDLSFIAEEQKQSFKQLIAQHLETLNR